MGSLVIRIFRCSVVSLLLVLLRLARRDFVLRPGGQPRS